MASCYRHRTSRGVCVCVSVGHNRGLCKKGHTEYSCGSKEPLLHRIHNSHGKEKFGGTCVGPLHAADESTCYCGGGYLHDLDKLEEMSFTLASIFLLQDTSPTPASTAHGTVSLQHDTAHDTVSSLEHNTAHGTVSCALCHYNTT